MIVKNRSSTTWTTAQVAGIHFPIRSGATASPMVSQTNANAKASRHGPSTGTIILSTTAMPVIASEPPIQTGVSIQ